MPGHVTQRIWTWVLCVTLRVVWSHHFGRERWWKLMKLLLETMEAFLNMWRWSMFSKSKDKFYLIHLTLQDIHQTGLLRKTVQDNMIHREILGSLVRSNMNVHKWFAAFVICQTKDDKLWYNAFEKDIAVANFYVSKPTALGNKLQLEA